MSRKQAATIEALGIEIVGMTSTIATLEGEVARLRERCELMELEACEGRKCVAKDEKEIARLRAALEVFASEESWQHREEYCGMESSDEAHWRWDEPWIDQGARWEDGGARNQPVTNPADFARKALEGIP